MAKKQNKVLLIILAILLSENNFQSNGLRGFMPPIDRRSCTIGIVGNFRSAASVLIIVDRRPVR